MESFKQHALQSCPTVLNKILPIVRVLSYINFFLRLIQCRNFIETSSSWWSDECLCSWMARLRRKGLMQGFTSSAVANSHTTNTLKKPSPKNTEVHHHQHHHHDDNDHETMIIAIAITIALPCHIPLTTCAVLQYLLGGDPKCFNVLLTGTLPSTINQLC